MSLLRTLPGSGQDNKEAEAGMAAVEWGGKEKESQKVDGDVPADILPLDSSNPLLWSAVKKWTMTGLVSSTGLNRIMVSTMMAPALSTIANDLHMNNAEAVMSLSVYLLATAFGPLIIGPLSEIFGRRPILHATNIWFLIWNIVCGFANSKGTLIAARFLAGSGASAVYVLGSAVLGDVWPKEQRGKTLGIYLVIPLLGAAIGPIFGGFISQYTTWRWMFWSTSCFQAVMIAISLPVFRETYAPVILRQKAARQGEHLTIEEGRAWRNLSRPFRMLLFHPIIQIQTILSAFAYGITYLVISTFSNLYVSQYRESVAISGLHYIALCIGEIVGAQLGGFLLDRLYRRTSRKENSRPEQRMLIMVPGAIVGTVGLVTYGWFAQYRLPWIAVDIGALILSLGPTVSGAAINAYMIDAYPLYVGSALASSQLLRSLTAFGFPLFAPSMYRVLGYGWGNTLLGLLFSAISIPAALLIWTHGAKLREKAGECH